MQVLQIVALAGWPVAYSPCVARLGTQPANAFRTELASTRDWSLRSYLELGALPTAVPCARLHAKNILCEWDMGSLADTVELLVSEIATNAVRASASTPGQLWSRYEGLPVIRLWIASNRDHVLIQDLPNPRTSSRIADVAPSCAYALAWMAPSICSGPKWGTRRPPRSMSVGSWL